MLNQSDAALLIGDPALKIDRSEYRTWDLAEEWIRLTGKPFVFAFWAVREAALERAELDLASLFQVSRDHGLEALHVQQIAELWAPRIGISEDVAREYLSSNIYYFLDDACLEGLRLFYQYSRECGALPEAPALSFVESRSAVSP